MASGSSRKVVFIAVGANLGIAVTKFVAAWFTRSSGMMSEGIHSLVDTGNQVLLLLGIYRSQKPPDEIHPFGHGKELYFWSLIVAILLFGVGGGMAMYEGIVHILQPKELEDPAFAYVVLLVAAGFEGYSWLAALKAMKHRSTRRSIWRMIRTTKDPAVLTVLLEDSAALTGITVAFLGVYLGHTYDNPYFDGAASIIIGLVLAMVALLLVIESKGLLLGESADPATVAEIRHMVADDPNVIDVITALTMHFGPEEVLLNLEIQFNETVTADGLIGTIDRLEAAIRKRYPEMTRIFIEAAPLSRRRVALPDN
ncbi:MAG: cation diffusion facilitator family transporter [Deltaproteobacteria bacterium]